MGKHLISPPPPNLTSSRATPGPPVPARRGIPPIPWAAAGPTQGRTSLAPPGSPRRRETLLRGDPPAGRPSCGETLLWGDPSSRRHSFRDTLTQETLLQGNSAGGKPSCRALLLQGDPTVGRHSCRERRGGTPSGIPSCREVHPIPSPCPPPGPPRPSPPRPLPSSI